MAAPDTIPNLDAWWKADSLALADGATVSSWADSGPGGWTATQGTAAARPTFRTGQINGLPVVRFDGVDDVLVASASTSHTETTIFAVIKPTSTTGDRSIRVASGSGGITSTIRDGKPRMGSQDLVSLHTSTTTVSTVAFQALTCSYSDSADTVAFYRNGSADGSSTSVTASPTAGRTTRIGAEPAGGFLVGDLAELIVYSRVLNSTERSQVHSYLQDKYAVAVADYVASTPTVDAGADVTVPVSLAWTRTATENDNGSAITSRKWEIVSGPAGVGTTLGTTATLTWTPGTSGAYVLRFSATNANGTGTDDVAVSVLPSYVRDFRVAQTNAATITVPHPPGTQSGDPMVAFCINDFIAATATGWTRDSAAGSSASDAALNIFRRVATSSETDHVFDVGASTSATVAVVAFNKLEVADTWDVAPVLETLTVTASTTTPTAPSITTVEAKAILFAVYGTVESGSGHGLHTPPTGMVELIDHLPSGTGRGLHIAALPVDPAGATGTKTATTAGTAKVYLAQAMAIKPRTAEQITVTDTATGVDTAVVSESSTVADTGTSADTVTVSDADTFVVADTGTGSDTVTTSDFTTEQIAAVDTATAVEVVTVAETATAADSGTAADTAVVAETFPVVDTATGVDTASVHDTHFVTAADTASGTDTVTVLDVPFTVFPVLFSGPTYELVAVARLPQQQGPPLFMEVDPIEWRSLRWADTLSEPQELEATALLTRLPPTVLQRLERPRAYPTELWLYRDGDLVFAGPLTGWSKGTDSVSVKAAGLLAYTWSMFVETDLRFDQTDQFTIARTLVDNWQGTEYGHFGIDTSAVGESGFLRDGTYARAEIHKVGQRIEELGRRRNGFDVEVDPSTRRLQLWHPLKGVDRSDGEDAIVIDERSITSGQVVCSVSPGDVASEGFGAGSSAGGDATLWSHQSNLDVRATYGRTGVAGTWSDVSEQPTLDAHVQGMLDARADALIVPGPGMRVTPDTDLGAYAVGDTILYDESHALLGPVGAFRIRKREVTVSPDGKQESVSIEFV